MELCTFTLSVLALNSRFLIICLFCLLDSKRLLFFLFPFSFFLLSLFAFMVRVVRRGTGMCLYDE
jgi:hypothetical protein